MTPHDDSDHWAFMTRPDTYDILAALRDGTPRLFTTKGKAVHAGDRVLVWKARGPDSERGVVALGEVLTEPRPLPDADDPYWKVRPLPALIEPRALVRFVLSPNLPLWYDDDSRSLLDRLSVSRARGGTVFRVSTDEWDALLDAVGGWLSEAPEIGAVEEAIARAAGKSGRDQGFGQPAAERRAIERHAMERAASHYRSLGWDVEDVADRESYDLRCRRGDDELRVEVKETTGDGTRVLLTRGEVLHARRAYPRVALFIVHDLEVESGPGESWRASGGEEIVVEPWQVDEAKLTALAYSYDVPVAGH